MATKKEEAQPNKAASIYAKLGAIQAGLKSPKDKQAFGMKISYNYRSAEQILERLKPLLSAQECAIVLTDRIENGYIIATATLYDYEGNSIQSQAMAKEEQNSTRMTLAQITGATSSYARKYALCGLFAIDDTKDVDTQEYQDAYQQAQAEQQQILQNVAKATTLDQLTYIYTTAPQNLKNEAFIAQFSARKAQILNNTQG